MVFIACFTKLEKDKLGWVDTGSLRVFGYYEKWESAMDAMHTNACDIRECLYDYGIIEEIEPGLYAYPKKRQFFKWDNEKEGFYEIPEPDFVKNVSNFTIG